MKKYFLLVVMAVAISYSQAQEVAACYFYAESSGQVHLYPSVTITTQIETGKIYTFPTVYYIKNTSANDLPAGTILQTTFYWAGNELGSANDTLKKLLEKDSITGWLRGIQVEVMKYAESQQNGNQLCAKVTKVDGADVSTTEACYTVSFSNPLAVEEMALTSMSVYPNPANDILTIELAENANVSVFNVTGQQVLTNALSAGTNRLDVSTLAEGLYFMKIQSGSAIKTQKIQIVR
ncbi:MAG: T9SS type A sorting domain-containing protein [Bacteroidales bacterium]|jgi:hypothetical protein|nr:T9SS type A sorting domain-containing protein [Bacteroidales bacterium]